MKSLLFLSLLPFTLSSNVRDIPTLDSKQPIYLGDVFWPPTMTFIAWTPTEENGPKDWCLKPTDCSDHRLFSLSGIEGLQIHDYFDTNAYLTREGKRFANCVITPESGRMSPCTGVQISEETKRFSGLTGFRKWSCWVDQEGWANETRQEDKPQEYLTGNQQETSTVTVYETVHRGSAEKSATQAAFTAQVTAS